MHKKQTINTIRQIVRLYFSYHHRESVRRDFRLWFFSTFHDEEKTAVTQELFEEVLHVEVCPDTLTYRAYNRVLIKIKMLSACDEGIRLAGFLLRRA